MEKLKKLKQMSRQPVNFMQDCMNNCRTWFLKYLVAQWLILEELFGHEMCADGFNELAIFDKFLIWDQFNWLWTKYEEILGGQLYHLQLDPVHKENCVVFSKCPTLKQHRDAC